MKKRFLALMTVGVMICTCLSGCGNSEAVIDDTTETLVEESVQEKSPNAAAPFGSGFSLEEEPSEIADKSESTVYTEDDIKNAFPEGYLAMTKSGGLAIGTAIVGSDFQLIFDVSAEGYESSFSIYRIGNEVYEHMVVGDKFAFRKATVESDSDAEQLSAEQFKASYWYTDDIKNVKYRQNVTLDNINFDIVDVTFSHYGSDDVYTCYIDTSKDLVSRLVYMENDIPVIIYIEPVDAIVLEDSLKNVNPEEVSASDIYADLTNMMISCSEYETTYDVEESSESDTVIEPEINTEQETSSEQNVDSSEESETENDYPAADSALSAG